MQVSNIISFLTNGKYDSDALMEDVGGWNDQKGDENSNCYHQRMDTVYKHIKRYIYQQKSMKEFVSHFAFLQSDIQSSL